MNKNPFLAHLDSSSGLSHNWPHTQLCQKGKNFGAKAEKNGADLKCYFCGDGGSTDLIEAQAFVFF